MNVMKLESKGINCQPVYFGIPLFVLPVAFALAFAAGASLPTFIMCLFSGYVARRTVFKEYNQDMILNALPAASMKIMVKGLLADFFTEIDRNIKNNNKVIISCSSPLFVHGLSGYVKSRLGFYKWNRVQGSGFKIEFEPLTNQSLFLHRSSGSDLQRAVNRLVDRGWITDGNYNVSKSLFSQSHSQIMLCLKLIILRYGLQSWV